MTISIKNLNRPNTTVIPNEFIDKFMSAANGEYVKVYLYLMRHSDEELTDEQIADALELTSGDIGRAIDYWSRQGVLEAGHGPDASEPEDEDPAVYSVDLRKLLDDSEFSELLYCLQKYTSRIFCHTETQAVAYMYDELKLPRELIEYLTEVCVQKGKTSMRYIEAIARDWHGKGITTLEEARRDMEAFSAETFGVMKAFGIKDRMPGASESEYIDRWFKEYGFGREIVTEACRRTMDTISKPSFKYADSILTRWKKEGVSTLADIERLDKEHTERSEKARERSVPKGKAVGSNFEQRKDDLDSRMLDRINDRLR